MASGEDVDGTVGPLLGSGGRGGGRLESRWLLEKGEFAC